MKKEMDIVALGELLVDFTQAGKSESGMRLFEQNPGGAPANLLTAASHMGYKTALIGKVGKDMHGSFLKRTLQAEGICADYVLEDSDYFTTLAFVAIDEKGERQFSFSRKPGADTQLKASELDRELLKSCKIFHFGSLSLTNEPSRSATLEAVRLAKEAGALISYDPNYRKSLWDNPVQAIDRMKSPIKAVDVMKVSDEECLLLTGTEDYREGAEELLAMGPKLVAVTLGGEGVFILTGTGKGQVPALPSRVVDTTGAGDSFWGGFLSQLLRREKKIEAMDWSELLECARYGNAMASLCVRRRGGIPAIPDKEEVEKFVRAWIGKCE
ncbi:MAG: carbohydrate kinase family protein [Lachnospiraceae bacterium]